MATPPGSIIRPAASCSGPMRACRSTGAPARWPASRTRFDVGNASGSSDNFHLGLYGGAQWGRLGLRLGAAHTWHALRVSRPVAFAGYADGLKSDYRAGTTQVFGDLGYRIDTAVGAVEPFVSAAYVNLRTGRIDERGGAAAARADRIPAWATPWACAHRARSRWAARPRPRASVAGAMRWEIRRRHRHSDLRGRRVHGGRRADREECCVDRGRHGCDAGPGTALGLAYSGMIGSSARDHGVKASLGIRF